MAVFYRYDYTEITKNIHPWVVVVVVVVVVGVVVGVLVVVVVVSGLSAVATAIVH